MEHVHVLLVVMPTFLLSRLYEEHPLVGAEDSALELRRGGRRGEV